MLQSSILVNDRSRQPSWLRTAGGPMVTRVLTFCSRGVIKLKRILIVAHYQVRAVVITRKEYHQRMWHHPEESNRSVLAHGNVTFSREGRTLARRLAR